MNECQTCVDAREKISQYRRDGLAWNLLIQERQLEIHIHDCHAWNNEPPTEGEWYWVRVRDDSWYPLPVQYKMGPRMRYVFSTGRSMTEIFPGNVDKWRHIPGPEEPND